jgi:MFS family permease
MDGVGGYAGWRWIFILEGLLTVVVAFIAPFAIYDSPEKATFLTKEEREWVIWSMRNQAKIGQSAPEDEAVHAKESSKFRSKYVWDALTDWQIYVGLFSMFT